MRLLALIALLTLGAAASGQTAQHRYTAVRQQEFSLSEGPGLLMPTGVAVGPGGLVYVVDGANDRLVIFDASGAPRGELRQIGAETLRNPMSARFDAEGRIWIADTGNHRVLIGSPEGRLIRSVRIAGEGTGPESDVTDFAVTSDARTLWAVDNDHHRLLEIHLADESARPLGKRGETLGLFQYPFAIDIASDGSMLVSDALNGRAQAFTPAGAPSGTIGSYGVELGNLYRPKGLRVDADGNIWISDGVLGVLSVFSQDGRFIDVLRATDGTPYRFSDPSGLTFDSQQSLYVVESGANRVVKLRIEAAHDAPRSVSAAARTSASPQSARGCTVCHIEWIEPLRNGHATELISPPENPPQAPAVSRGSTCWGCHDGVAADSRRMVAGAHAHQPERALPATMGTGDLPLVNGVLDCRTCHMAHGPNSGSSIEKIVYLRTRGDAASLCLKCHADLGGAGDRHSHPLGRSAAPIPDRLRSARQQSAPDSVDCLTCHAGHRTPDAPLLRAPIDDNSLCLSCHSSLSSELFDETHRSAHGRLPQLSDEQAAYLGELGRGSESGKLRCVSCHSTHHAPQENLLAIDMRADAGCLRCHSEMASVAESPHDLRASHPELKDRHGASISTAGPCAACHSAHAFNREALPNAADGSGKCRACHAPQSEVHATSIGDRNHPNEACSSCHNPHKPEFGQFLAQPVETLCTSCHTQEAGVHGGGHDPARLAAGGSEFSDCRACHRPHGDEQHGLWRAETDLSGGPDAVCLGCHKDAAWQGHEQRGALHPRVAANSATTALPLGEMGADQCAPVACRTCHDPHSGKTPGKALLRVADDQRPDALCMTCHSAQQYIELTGHAPQSLAQAGLDSQSCLPCHSMHGDARLADPDTLWTRPVTRGAGDRAHPADAICESCHFAGGTAAPPPVATHPRVVMLDPTAPQSSLPIFDEQGRQAALGFIACRTCHQPHGKKPPEESYVQVRRAQLHLRAYEAPNVCSTCHRADGLRRFLYFHDPQRRAAAGSTDAPTPGRPEWRTSEQ